MGNCCCTTSEDFIRLEEGVEEEETVAITVDEQIQKLRKQAEKSESIVERGRLHNQMHVLQHDDKS